MTRVIALMALVALGLSEAPVHEPVHGRRQTISVIVTQRSAETSAQRRPIWRSGSGDPGRRPRTKSTLHCRIERHLESRRLRFRSQVIFARPSWLGGHFPCGRWSLRRGRWQNGCGRVRSMMTRDARLVRIVRRGIGSVVTWRRA